MNGYCYGFIQAFHKKNKAKELIDRLHLYTKVCDKKEKHNYYLGYIDKVEVLKQPFTQKALIDKKNSFCKQAENDLTQLKIVGYQKDLNEMCSEDTLFNVRFEPKNVHIKDFNFQQRPILLPHGWNRFNLYDLSEEQTLLNHLNKF
jgi:hypothetical protein